MIQLTLYNDKLLYKLFYELIIMNTFKFSKLLFFKYN